MPCSVAVGYGVSEGHAASIVTSSWIWRQEVSLHITTQRHNPEDHDLNLKRRENLKSRYGSVYFRGFKEIQFLFPV
jgi:hypothetical protein